MAEISSYPIITPKAQDVLVGTETYVASVAEVLGNPTRGFTVQSIVDLAVVGTYLSVTGGTITGDLTIDGALTLKATNSGGFGSFGVLNTEGGTGAILVNGTLNITGDIVQQGTNASITLTSPTAAIYMTSPDGTVYKVQMANGGTFDITEV
jgi:hypothetical protein